MGAFPLLSSIALNSPSSSNDNPSPLLLLRVVRWLTGLSLSTVTLFFALFLTTIVLRRKGYGIRLGVACLILYARPGSRRFPDGVEVRITTRLVGFFFGGGRGPWLDIHSDRFYMRLRPTTPSDRPLNRRPPLPRLVRFLSIGFAAVNPARWKTFLQNILNFLLAPLIRGLRLRVEKARIWKDGASWDIKAEQLILAGRAVGVFGSKFSLSVNELYVNVEKPPADPTLIARPITASIALRRGVEVSAVITPRFSTLTQSRRLAVLDDVRVSLTVRDLSCSAPRLLDASITNLNAEFCPGHSRTLRAKLPPTPPPTRRPRRPSLLHYWECNGAIRGLSVRFSAPLPPPRGKDEALLASLSLSSFPTASQSLRDFIPPPPNSDNGAFIRLDTLRFDAYGKAGDERYEGMMHASMSLHGCSAGSIAVDALSHTLYEAVPAAAADSGKQSNDAEHGRIESIENIDKIVAARPELLFWMEDLQAALDVNCSKRHATRLDLASNGGVVAVEPVGLVILVKGISEFFTRFVGRSPKRTLSVSSFDTESFASLPRSSSSTSINSALDDPTSLRLVADMRHLTAVVLGRGPVGDGDTMAVVLSSEAISIPAIDVNASSLTRVMGSTTNITLMHWSRWERRTNLVCEEAKFEVQRGANNEKSITVNNCTIDWDLDAQSGLQMLPSLLGVLKQLRSSNTAPDRSGLEVIDPSFIGAQSLPRAEYDRIYLSESERVVRREKRHSKLLDVLSSWTVGGTELSVTASFPDGPSMGVSVGALPECKLNSESFYGCDVVVSIQDCKLAYAAELRLGSPFHTLKRSLEKRSINIEVNQLKALVGHELQFGYLLQDWLLRLRSAIRVMKEIRLQKKGSTAPTKQKKTPIPDIHFKASDVEIYFEDHPVSGFLTKMMPLMQDEARERERREESMAARIEQLRKIARAEIAGTPARCMNELMKKDSEIWINRVGKLKEVVYPLRLADGFLPDLEFPPASVFSAGTLSFDIVLDDLARQNGSSESIRRLKMLDDYELGSKKHNKTRQHEPDAWNSIGFRSVGFEATCVKVSFRDFQTPFVEIDKMHFDNTTFGQAAQATVAPYVGEAKVAIGRRRVVRVVKSIGPTKTFCDIHLKIDTLQCGFNPSHLTSIVDFGRGISRFFGGGKNPSPRIPWFDSLRVSMHGRMRITAKKFKGHLTSSISPYSMTKHFAEIEVDNFEMLTSRLEPTMEDPFPISWKFYNWHIRPSSFDDQRRSEIVFDFVRVGLNPVFTVNCGDPQDHYFVPFPTKEEVAAGGPGIGKGTVDLEFVNEPVSSSDTGFGNFTDWYTGLHRIPGHDSYAGFKTRDMILGIDVCVRHPKSRSHLHRSVDGFLHSPFLGSRTMPLSTSVIYSDAISTLTKVIKVLVWRPISCRLPVRKITTQRKPPSLTGFTTSLKGLDLFVDVKDLNLMLYNNLEPGHGLFVSVDSVQGELWKRTNVTIEPNGDIKRDSRLTRRRFEINGIYSSIKVPDLDMAVDDNDFGKLLTVDKIALTDDIKDELRYMASPRKKGRSAASVAASGFGLSDLSESPFYTFSANHPLQRGARLDKVTYDKRLLVDRVRLIWSPARRASMFAWPDAFKEKTFNMKAPKKHWADTSEKEQMNEKKSQDMFERLITRPLPTEKDTSTSESSGVYDSASPESTSDTDNMPTLTLTGGRAAESRAIESLDLPLNNQSAGRLQLVDMDPVDFEKDSAFMMNHSDPLSPTVVPMTRSKLIVKQKHVGDMKDLLSPYQTRKTKSEVDDSKDSTDASLQKQVTTGSMEILKTSPKFVLYINDCEVAFGSPETVGFVFLTSKSVRMGIVEKQVQKRLQLEGKAERWVDREYRIHLDGTEVFTRDKMHGKFDFSAKSWVPTNPTMRRDMALVTSKPICMDLMYIVSSSVPHYDGEEEEEDHILRPSLLFINVPDIRLSTNAEEFHAITDVVRKVLMQGMKSSEIVNEELTQLRYKLQLAEGRVSSEELDDFMRRLNNITKQFLYAGDTFQHPLVDSLVLPEKDFPGSLLRYKAKAKAVATFMRKDQRAMTTDVLYPTMYVSYSFDKCSWELREKYKETNRETEDAFVEITLDDLVCRHIFFVGRGSSAEITFANISAQNKMRSSYFQRILQPAGAGTNYGPGGYKRKASHIKASDGAAVAFRWYSTQEDRVGGIPVYELLTIQVAPMTAAVTRKLYKSVSEFIFSSRSRTDTEDEAVSEVRAHGSFSRGGGKSLSGQSASNSVTRAGSFEAGTTGGRRNGGQESTAKLDEVTQMTKRGESSMLFKYVFIDAFELTASYKNKENNARGALDFFDLFVTTPSFSYSSQVWTWKDFTTQIRKDLVTTFFIRMASNLAKIKLLPGYSRARKRLAAGLMQGADSIRGSFYARLPAAVSGMEGEGDGEDGGGEDDEGEDGVVELAGHGAVSADEGDVLQDDTDRRIDSAVAEIDISTEEGNRRKEVLSLLYGTPAKGAGPQVPARSSRGFRGDRSLVGGSETSHESIGVRTSIRARARVRGHGRPPAAPDGSSGGRFAAESEGEEPEHSAERTSRFFRLLHRKSRGGDGGR